MDTHPRLMGYASLCTSSEVLRKDGPHGPDGTEEYLVKASDVGSLDVGSLDAGSLDVG